MTYQHTSNYSNFTSFMSKFKETLDFNDISTP